MTKQSKIYKKFMKDYIPNNLPIEEMENEIIPRETEVAMLSEKDEIIPDFSHKDETKEEARKRRRAELLSRTQVYRERATPLLAILGLILGLIAIISIAIMVVRYSPVAFDRAHGVLASLSNAFESEKVSAHGEAVTSGKPFVLSWNHENKTKDGSYTLYYPCVDGVYIKVKSKITDEDTVLCNKDYQFINIDNSISITAFSEKFGKVDLPITISFTRNGEKETSITGVTNINITNDSIVKKENAQKKDAGSTIVIKEKTETTTPKKEPVTTNTTSKNTGTVSYGGTTSNPNGRADLTPSIVSLGIMDSANNFIATNSPKRTDRIAVKFRIENIGDKTSQSFVFTAILPTSPSYVFVSETQAGIAPQSGVDYTLVFDRVIDGTGTFTVKVDPAQNITESNISNNSTSLNIKAI